MISTDATATVTAITYYPLIFLFLSLSIPENTVTLSLSASFCVKILTLCLSPPSLSLSLSLSLSQKLFQHNRYANTPLSLSRLISQLDTHTHVLIPSLCLAHFLSLSWVLVHSTHRDHSIHIERACTFACT